MRLKSDIVRNEILQIAKEEFLKKGFRDASLREIAKKANKTTGVIYTYFKNKNEIFTEIVKPATNWFNNRFSLTENATDEEIKRGLESLDISYDVWLVKGYRLFVEITDNYRDELFLLFFKSSGSTLEDFFDQILEKATQRGIKIFRNFERTENFKSNEISDFFIRNFTAFNLNMMKEMIKLDKSKKEMLLMENEFTSFSFYGWKALINL